MRAEELLNEVEPLPFGERCHRLAELGRAADAPDLARLLDELADGGHYERSTALFVASAVRDEASLAHIARATRDPDAELATRAIDLAAKLGVGAEAFEALLEDAPAAVRAAVVQAIRRHRRRDLAEQLIDATVARWGEEEAAALLPACGEEVTRARLDGLAHAVPNWTSFGRAHPGVMLDHAESRLSEVPEAMLYAWWSRQGEGVAAAVPYAPGRVVTLMERFLPAGQLPFVLNERVGVLLDAEPERMLRLLLSDKHQGALPPLLWRSGIRHRLAAFDDARVAEVARAIREEHDALRSLLKALPPSRREAVFTAAMRGVDLTAAELGEDLLDVLPQAVRVREARRMLGLPRVAQTPQRHWEITSFLPYDEALPVLAELTRRPDAGDRATGYRLLIRCAGRARDPQVLTRLFEALGRLRNEQDPVRLRTLEALAAIPPGPLRAEHVPAIVSLAENTLSARDLSYGTRHQLTMLAATLARQGAIRGDVTLVVPAFEILARLAGESGSLHVGGEFGEALRRGQEHELVRALSPHLAAGTRRDDRSLALTLATALRRRAFGVPELQDALAAALDARDDRVIRRAIELWLAAPGTRGERVERVLAKEPSAIAVPAVFRAVARVRTDLLHLVLSGNAAAGRFRRPDVTYVPLAQQSWMRRWTGRQRAAYLTLLRRLAGDVGVPAGDRARAVRTIARVPGAEAAELRRYMDPELLPYSDTDDRLLFRQALTAAPWLSSPQDVLPDLLRFAASDHAHVALYAASRAARFVPPSALAEALGPVLAEGKITARKEALRILLRNRVPRAAELIAAVWDDPDQHRDVRAAIVSAVREHLGEPVAWRILDEAATGERALARQVVGASPLTVEERFRERYAALVLRVARSDDREARDAALYGLADWAPWAPEVPALLARLAGDLGDHSWQGPLRSLVRCAMNGDGVAELAAAASALSGEPAEPDAGAERDLPALQRLVMLATLVRDAARPALARAEPVLRALDGRLPEPLASRLIAATLRWDAPDVGATLDALAERPIGGVLAVWDVAQALVPETTGWSRLQVREPDPEHVYPHAARLAARGDVTGGLFACVLTGHHGRRSGWSEQWRDLLRGLRAHPRPDVVHAALGVHTASE